MIKKELLKDSSVYFLVVAVVLVALYFALNKFNYFDPTSFCYIDIDGHILGGNKRTIQDALRSIRRNDKSQYKTVCRYVRKISENYCIGSDWHLNPQWKHESIGKDCYIRGSKTIYLYPRKEGSLEISSNRARSIMTLSNFSKEFWEKNK
jgi:hypothetical protein